MDRRFYLCHLSRLDVRAEPTATTYGKTPCPFGSCPDHLVERRDIDGVSINCVGRTNPCLADGLFVVSFLESGCLRFGDRISFGCALLYKPQDMERVNLVIGL